MFCRCNPKNNSRKHKRLRFICLRQRRSCLRISFIGSSSTMPFVSDFMNGIFCNYDCQFEENIWNSSTISQPSQFITRRRMFFFVSIVFVLRDVLIDCCFSFFKIWIAPPHQITISQNAWLEGFRPTQPALLAAAAIEVRVEAFDDWNGLGFRSFRANGSLIKRKIFLSLSGWRPCQTQVSKKNITDWGIFQSLAKASLTGGTRWKAVAVDQTTVLPALTPGKAASHAAAIPNSAWKLLMFFFLLHWFDIEFFSILFAIASSMILFTLIIKIE